MLAIARSLVSRPQLLLLDEVSLGLMPTLVEQTFADDSRSAPTGGHHPSGGTKRPHGALRGHTGLRPGDGQHHALRLRRRAGRRPRSEEGLFGRLTGCCSSRCGGSLQTAVRQHRRTVTTYEHPHPRHHRRTDRRHPAWLDGGLGARGVSVRGRPHGGRHLAGPHRRRRPGRHPGRSPARPCCASPGRPSRSFWSTASSG